MVKRIEKTYSVKDGQIRKAVTLSTEEPLPSQSPMSYSYDRDDFPKLCRNECDRQYKLCVDSWNGNEKHELACANTHLNCTNSCGYGYYGSFELFDPL